LFAVALSYLFFFVAEIGGHARCYTNPIARFSDRPLPYSPAKNNAWARPPRGGSDALNLIPSDDLDAFVDRGLDHIL
jgi:hypothetical protein